MGAESLVALPEIVERDLEAVAWPVEYGWEAFAAVMNGACLLLESDAIEPCRALNDALDSER